ncbi:LCP family protein [Candidatus Azambacteria bacterium]|nr:LCP family protein [Candidatus Azambacteria bacterium]
MDEYNDDKLKTALLPSYLLWLARIFGVLFFSSFVFFANATELAKPPQTSLGAATAVKTAFSFLTQSEESIKGEDRDRVNILFLGMPGGKNSAPFLTDSIILASIKPSTNQLALLSIPRDLLVYLEKEKRYAKINSLFIMNEKNPELIESEIKKITGQGVDYYVALDMSAVEKVVDALGGLNVFVPQNIYDASFPTDSFGTEVFEVKQGWRYFDGKTVQKYLRTRHSSGGDFARMDQQQAVIEALRKKLFGLNLFLDMPTLLSLYSAVAASLQTDISDREIKSLYSLIKNISYDKIVNKVLNGGSSDSLLVSGTFSFGGQGGFILKPKAGDFDYSEIQYLTSSIFYK